MKALLTLGALLIAPTCLVAQTSNAWVVPKAFATQNATSTNSFPWTYTGYVRLMQVIDMSEFGGPKVLEALSLRPRQWASAQQQPFTLDFSIRLSLSANPVGQLSGTYANNIKGTQTEVYRGPVYFHTPSGNSPAEFSVTIPFTTRFVYTGPEPLLVDIVPISPCAGGGSGQGCDYDPTASTMQCVLGKNKAGCGEPTSGGFTQSGGYVMKFWGPSLFEYGYGCAGSSGQPQISFLGGAPQVGNTSFIMEVLNAKPSSAAALFLGFSRSTLFSTFNLPLDLTGLGAPGCWLWTDITLLGSAPTSPSGRGLLPLPIPNDPNFRGGQLFLQWAVLDAQANPAGLSFTPGGMALLR
jgi:hypothetical protein